jgi:hypothetical protein
MHACGLPLTMAGAAYTVHGRRLRVTAARAGGTTPPAPVAPARPRRIRWPLMRSRTALVLAAAAAALAPGCGDVEAPARAAPDDERLAVHRSGLHEINLSRHGGRPGDAFAATGEVAGGGYKETYCVRSPRPRTAWCAVTIVRPDGQLSAEGVFEDAPLLSGTIAVLSGSGPYADARGTLTTTGVAAAVESITLELR